MTSVSGFRIIDAAGVTAWRVGRAPDPWAWIDYRYAGEQRWDDSGNEFRTIYAADSLYACFVEILAHLRPDQRASRAKERTGVASLPSAPVWILSARHLHRRTRPALLPAPKRLLRGR